MTRLFSAGDRVLLVDTKRRRHLVTLAVGGQFHTHAGVLEHDALIGQPEGINVRTTLGQRLTAVRPTLAEYVLEMPRGAQVIYPKDLGPILVLADVFPGARVLESGVGSGALTLALLRAVGAGGQVTGYEIRDDFARRARTNVEGFLGADLPLDIEVRDAYAGIEPPGGEQFDRILLDLPEPWRVVKHAEAALQPGGILLAYLPTIGQVARLREELAGSAFGMAESLEVLQRSWHVDGQSVRPDHRMVAHTGFLTHARLLAPPAVNFLDLVVVLTAVAAGMLGYRLGFVRRGLSWAGLALGIVLAIVLVDDVAGELRGSPPRTRLLVSLAFVALLATVGQGVGFAIGSALHQWMGRAGAGVRQGDRVAGAALGVVGVLALVWLLIPALASSPGWPAGAVRESAVARAIDDLAPRPPDAASALGRLVGDQTFPEVFDSLTTPDAGDPPAGGVAPDIAARVARSVVKVEGVACDRVQDGTGFVAGRDLIVTNAHVVAGEPSTDVDTSDGRRLRARVIAFDPRRDLAVLRVDSLGLPPLALGDGVVDMRGSLFGHPRGGDLRESPVRIAEEIVAEGTDIWRETSTERRVFVLAAVAAPGDSGAPVVDEEGRVLGVLFALDLSRPTTAYALTDGELSAVLGPVVDSGTTASVGTGRCLNE